MSTGLYDIAMASLIPDPIVFGRAVRDLRLALRWTQRELGRRAGLSQSAISDIERGRVRRLSVRTVERVIGELGGRLELRIVAPQIVGVGPQADPAHARCVAFVARRLEGAGWHVATEVEVGEPGRRGWIDILAWHPVTHVLLVIEVKTEIRDVGAIERSMSWYERGAPRAARERGWSPGVVVGALIVLGTGAVEGRIHENRASFDRAFPGRAVGLKSLVATGTLSPVPRRYLAMVDPLSRRVEWLRPLRVDGRRSPAPYADYASFVRARAARSRAHRRTIVRPG